ncbi:MAG: fibronectin type III domain-containing protein, partial [Candidatus Aenigmarchaeota archaeon]|nr:fibronectin type III domain-containing protein [Candidatus Aenigmarchaeota archaeon]
MEAANPVRMYPPTDIDSGSWILSWSRSTDGDFTYYKVYRSDSYSYDWSTVIHTTTDIYETSYTVYPAPDTTYYFWVENGDEYTWTARS